MVCNLDFKRVMSSFFLFVADKAKNFAKDVIGIRQFARYCVIEKKTEEEKRILLDSFVKKWGIVEVTKTK